MIAEIPSPEYIDFRLTPEFRTNIDLQDFKNSMAVFASAVCVVTARAGDTRLGRTATSVMSLTVTPPTILAAINSGSALADAIRATGGFSIAALSETQHQIADAFAGQGPPEKRFDGGRWDSWRSGHPRLIEAVWSMDCALTGIADIGSHLLFAGGVSALEVAPRRRPLVWHHRGYNGLHPLGPVSC